MQSECEYDSGEKTASRLAGRFLEWETVRETGSPSTIWTDGYALNYIRNFILSLKGELEKTGFLPELYYRNTPPKMPEEFMLNADEISRAAEETQRTVLESGDYEYIVRSIGGLDERQKNDTGVFGIFHMIERMCEDIEHDRTVNLKKYSEVSRMLGMLSECRKNVEELIAELKDLTEQEEKKPAECYEQMHCFKSRRKPVE